MQVFMAIAMIVVYTILTIGTPGALGSIVLPPLRAIGKGFYLIIDTLKRPFERQARPISIEEDKLRHYEGSQQDFIREYGYAAFEALVSTASIQVDLSKHVNPNLPHFKAPQAPKYKYRGIVEVKIKELKAEDYEEVREMHREEIKLHAVKPQYEY